MRPLSNKALAVLELLRCGGEWTCKDLAARIEADTPCGFCGGSGEGDDSRYECRRCYGRGQRLFSYSDAYVALKQLMARGLVRRRYVTDEWGDETPSLVHSAVSDAEAPADALEATWALPAAVREGQEKP